jgi:hypothetical protein
VQGPPGQPGPVGPPVRTNTLWLLNIDT